jgi:hypothetical protein
VGVASTGTALSYFPGDSMQSGEHTHRASQLLGVRMTGRLATLTTRVPLFVAGGGRSIVR